MTTYLILGITYAFAAAMQPGPFQTYVIAQTLSRGWKRTLPAAFAPLKKAPADLYFAHGFTGQVL